MFTAALFTITKIQKQPKYPSTDEWTKEIRYIYVYTHTQTQTYQYIRIMEHYSAIKNEILPFAATWMDLEGIMLSEISQRLYDTTYTWNLKNTTH